MRGIEYLGNIESYMYGMKYQGLIYELSGYVINHGVSEDTRSLVITGITRNCYVWFLGVAIILLVWQNY